METETCNYAHRSLTSNAVAEQAWIERFYQFPDEPKPDWIVIWCILKMSLNRGVDLVMQTILEGVQQHWQDLRGRTYDLMDVLSGADLKARLPFQESQDVLYQFHCMLGTQESWAPVLLEGKMKGWACSLQSVEPSEAVSMDRIREAMIKADVQLQSTFEQVDWLKVFGNGTSPLMGYLRLTEHEAHHHGQLINFIYACGFPIPDSWADSWALSRSIDKTV